MIVTEFSCYVVSLGGIAFISLMHKIYPFSLLSEVFYSSETGNKIGAPNLIYLILAIYGMCYYKC